MKKIVAALSMIAFTQAHAARDAAQRTRVTVRCIEATSEATRTLYEAEIEGPDATDFDVALIDRDFEMTATFVNERIDAGTSDVRMKIDHRRRAGVSLWEEGTKQQRVRIRADEQIELLPFGGAGPRGTLKFEITREDASGSAGAPVSIAIRKQETSAIRVRAYRVPHWYRVEATIGGQTSVARLFRDEAGRILVHGTELRVTASAPLYQDAFRATQVHFDASRNGRLVANGWEGITAGAPLTYRLIDGTTLQLAVRPEE